MINDINNDIQGKSRNGEQPVPGTVEGGAPVIPQPPTAILRPDSFSWLSPGAALLQPLVESFAGGVLVIFMLLKREDLRNRLIRLMGPRRITIMTRAFDDAGQRVSRFLLMQALINGTFGLAIALGLAAIGVNYAFLWGFLTALLRYIPYLGTWIAAALPLLLSLAQFGGWVQPVLVFALFLSIEMVTANGLEPWLIGQSIGVSPVALLVATAFWAFLWGPVGLVLSSPLTVCLVVIGKYVPQLAFLDVLFGDDPPLQPHVSFYQRLLAQDQDEAVQLVLNHLATHPRDQVYDDLLLPALRFTRLDRQNSDLGDEEEEFIMGAQREIIEEIAEAGEELPQSQALETGNGQEKEPASPPVLVLGCPARDTMDQLGLEMLQHVLDPARWEMEIAAPELLTAELLAHIALREPALICIASLPPGGLAHTRYLCKRLRTRFPRIKILVGRWGQARDSELATDQLQQAGADLITTSLLETRKEMTTWLPVLSYQQRNQTVNLSVPAS